MKQGDNAPGSVRPSVCLSLGQCLTPEVFDMRGSPLPSAAKSNNHHCPSVCNQWAFVDNHADVVNRLLIIFFILFLSISISFSF